MLNTWEVELHSCDIDSINFIDSVFGIPHDSTDDGSNSALTNKAIGSVTERALDERTYKVPCSKQLPLLTPNKIYFHSEHIPRKMADPSLYTYESPLKGYEDCEPLPK
jgi:hypothetical protein